MQLLEVYLLLLLEVFKVGLQHFETGIMGIQLGSWSIAQSSIPYFCIMRTRFSVPYLYIKSKLCIRTYI